MDAEAARKKRLEEIEEKKKRLARLREEKKQHTVNIHATPHLPSGRRPHLAQSDNTAPTQRTQEEVEEENRKKEEETHKIVAELLPDRSSEVHSPRRAAEAERRSKEEIIASFSTVTGNPIQILARKKNTVDKGEQTEDDDMLFFQRGGEDEDSVQSSVQLITESKDMNDMNNGASMGVGFDGELHDSDHHHHRLHLSRLGSLPLHASLSNAAKVLSEEQRDSILNDKRFQGFLSQSSLVLERALEQCEQVDILRDFSTDDNNAAAAGATDSRCFHKRAAPFIEDSLRGRPVMDLKCSPLVPQLFLAAYGAKVQQQQQQLPHHHHQNSRGAIHVAGFSSAPNVLSPSAAAATVASTAAAVRNDEDAPGMVCVWSQHLHKRPEFKFTASSPVLTALFHPHESHLVLGGCYSGQILLWDMRSGRSLPVQRSSMAGRGHKHPVYAMAVTSSSVAAELVSVSTDGTVCHWDITDLVEPTSVTSLYGAFAEHGLYSNSSSSGNSSVHSRHQSLLSHVDSHSSGGVVAAGEPLNICAMAFGHAADVNAGSESAAAAAAAVDKLTHSHSATAATGNTGVAQDILFGSGSGHLIRSPLPYKPGDHGIVKINAHYGLITALQPHPNRSNKYKNLVLTSSLDWSVKLWNLGNFEQPVFEFFASSYEYVCDVQWSPIHPAVFVTITSGGKVGFWNLCKSTTEPVETFTVAAAEEATPSIATAGAAAASSSELLKRQHSHSVLNSTESGSGAALNRIAFAKDGLSVLVGDSLGVLHWIKLRSNAALPAANDEARFELALVTGAKSKAAVLAAAEAAALAAAAESKLSISEFDEDEEDDYYREMQRSNGGMLSQQRQISRASPTARSMSAASAAGFNNSNNNSSSGGGSASEAADSGSSQRRSLSKRSSLQSVREFE